MWREEHAASVACSLSRPAQARQPAHSPWRPPLPRPRHGAEALDLCLTSILGRQFGSIRQRSKLNVKVGWGGVGGMGMGEGGVEGGPWGQGCKVTRRQRGGPCLAPC